MLKFELRCFPSSSRIFFSTGQKLQLDFMSGDVRQLQMRCERRRPCGMSREAVSISLKLTSRQKPKAAAKHSSVTERFREQWSENTSSKDPSEHTHRFRSDPLLWLLVLMYLFSERWCLLHKPTCVSSGHVWWVQCKLVRGETLIRRAEGDCG